MQTFSVRTGERCEFVNITRQVQDVLQQAGVYHGLVTVFVPHTTAGITINENADPDVLTDIKHALERVVPWQNNYRHGEGNSAAHVKASLMGSSIQVAVADGRMALGQWQGIYFAEFDGPRVRTVSVAWCGK